MHSAVTAAQQRKLARSAVMPSRPIALLSLLVAFATATGLSWMVLSDSDRPGGWSEDIPPEEPSEYRQPFATTIHAPVRIADPRSGSVRRSPAPDADAAATATIPGTETGGTLPPVLGADPGNRPWRWRGYDDANPRSWLYGEQNTLDLRGHDFEEADLADVVLANANLQGANLKGANLRRADLRGADLEGAVISRTVFDSADLRNATLRNTDMGWVNLGSTDLRGADLRGARVACRDCSSLSVALFTNFSGADLRGVDFGKTFIKGALMEGADLRGADMALTHGWPASLRYAKYNDRTRLPAGIDPAKRKMVYVPGDD